MTKHKALYFEEEFSKAINDTQRPGLAPHYLQAFTKFLQWHANCIAKTVFLWFGPPLPLCTALTTPAILRSLAGTAPTKPHSTLTSVSGSALPEKQSKQDVNTLRNLLQETDACYWGLAR